MYRVPSSVENLAFTSHRLIVERTHAERLAFIRTFFKLEKQVGACAILQKLMLHQLQQSKSFMIFVVLLL